ncbi:DUF2066 domain-containing protein [Bradyrhizobium lablabi]|uniref:DUF2066 domain-containing protein n=1 Tax=Bradyrhizobium lablabi TaxID=722472 RepID=UPI001BA54156|nr:DUF2066 domain-containing protein [Bradyrhizobium lablabi]MBR1121139.1 DUF2066 domain-containing protein [Bradyrhizobium lablabi]
MKRYRSLAIARMFVTAFLIWCAGAMAANAADLYRTKTVVTGQGEANRLIGFGRCLEDVLIKVSGAQKLAGDRRLAVHKSNAKDFVKAFSYRDQFEGKPIRDEQGTRDRPYDLTVDFDEKKIDDLLGKLGLKPWLSPRPRLFVLAEMEQGARKFFVTADGAKSDLQRDALLDAADRRGMAIVLPPKEIEARGTWAGRFEAPAGEGPILPLTGHLVWDDRALGWATDWELQWQGRPHRWQVRGVTFDEAFRRGLGGAAQILSGNGDPAGR